MKFDRKSYGAIYVDKKENIDRVKKIIETVDEYEYDYLPKDLIKTFENFGQVSYTHKFYDIDMDIITKICFNEGIFILCMNYNNEYGFDIKKYELDNYIVEKDITNK